MGHMKVFVGTLECGEEDFQQCIKAISLQENVVVTHHVINNLPEKEAHNKLWAAWRIAKQDHDVFVKIDADTVLKTNTTLTTICELFKDNSRLTGIQAYLHDHLTSDLIYGLNCFSKKVIFNDTTDELYCDRKIDTGHDIVLRGNQLPSTLIPAADHCKFASKKQAFHYGVHRALKNQKDIYEKVCNAVKLEYSDARYFAKKGFECASLFIEHKKFNYNDNEFNELFEKALKNEI